MRLNSTLFACLAFHSFAREHGADGKRLAELIALAKARARAAAAGKPDEKLRERVRSAAAFLGFGVEFNGLMPTLLKGGRSCYLPNV